MLIQLRSQIWPILFGNTASGLEQQIDDSNGYMLYDDKPFVSQFISHPPDTRSYFTTCSFVAGIVEGFLCSNGFTCKVSAIPKPTDKLIDRVIYLIKFENE
jgi:hypothetical protein